MRVLDLNLELRILRFPAAHIRPIFVKINFREKMYPKIQEPGNQRRPRLILKNIIIKVERKLQSRMCLRILLDFLGLAKKKNDTAIESLLPV